MRKKNNILIIGFIEIFKKYRRKHYGDMVIDYLLYHYKIKCILGESLNTAAKFWNDKIKNHKGNKIGNVFSRNCKYTFTIPKYDIDDKELKYLMDISLRICN